MIVSVIVHLTGGVASYFASLYTLPIIAASTVQSWRGGLMVSVLSSLMYSSLVVAQYEAPGLLPLGAPPEVLPLLRVAVFTVGLNVFGFLAVAALSGYLAEGLRQTGAAAGPRLVAARRSAGVQPARHRQPHERPGDLRHGRPDPHLQPRGGNDHRRWPRPTSSGRRITDILQLPGPFQNLFAVGARPTGTAAPRVRLSPLGRPRRSRSA